MTFAIRKKLNLLWFFIVFNALNFAILEKRILPNILNGIFVSDQKYRLILKQMKGNVQLRKRLIDRIAYNDQLNTIKVKSILRRYGWPGKNEIGVTGSDTIFLVIQHSNISDQLLFLPILKQAVKEKKISIVKLAIFEDRIAVNMGKKQKYGSQIGSTVDGRYYVLPVKNPKKINLIRKKVGLEPYDEYLKNWGLKWNPHNI